MPEATKDYSTPQEQTLVSAGLCSGVTARALGLSFADRDVELITYLKTVQSVPDTATLPSPLACMQPLKVEERWASMVVERVGQFMRKAARGTDYSAIVSRFTSRPDIAVLAPKLRKLRPGVTAFIGDSNMDYRHWSCDASFPILVGSFLQDLGVGPYVNAGIGGETARDGIVRFDRDVAAHQPVRIVIGFGGNDLNTKSTMPQILEDLNKLIRRSRALNADITITGLRAPIGERLWWTGGPVDPKGNDRVHQLNAKIQSMAAEQGLGFLDNAALLSDEDICSDGIHMRQSGHEKLAIQLLWQWA